MSSIHKVRWTSGGKEKIAWAVDYFDQDRKKRRRTFKTQREAKEWDIAAQGEIKAGKHTPDSKSITVIEAMRLWLDRCRLRIDLDGDEKLEWSTVRQYDSHAGHIAKSSIAAVKLSRLAMPMVEALKDELLGKVRSSATARKILTSLKMAIAEAQRRGLVAQNVATDVRYGKRKRRPIVEGEDLPTKAELQAILAHAGQWYPLLVTAAFTGMRSSELRGLRWGDVDFGDRAAVQVRRRADARRIIGEPKSAAGTRTITLIDMVVNALRTHRIASKWSGDDDYVFCNSVGRITFHQSIQSGGFIPVQLAAGINPAKYGLHSLRHFYASWLIGLRHYSPKEIQTMLGHATLAMTFDTYGHLLTKSEEEEHKDRAKLEAASHEFRLIAT
jgi:integrase